jgi:hypothetical protein
MTLSDREKNLSLAVGAIVFVLLNLMIISALARRNTALHQQLSDRRLELTQINALLDTRGDWAARDAALTRAQPQLGNENAAGVELLNLIHTLANKANLTPDNEVLGRVTKTPYYRSVAVTVDTHSTWPHLIAFLYSLQGPTNFIVCESANIQVDPADPSKMLGHFKIARWYAP